MAWISLTAAKSIYLRQMKGESAEAAIERPAPPSRPGEWLEYNPLLTVIVVALAGYWLWQEFASKDAILAISNLNTYNFLFIMAGLLLHWRPKRFLNAVAKSVPATAVPSAVA